MEELENSTTLSKKNFPEIFTLSETCTHLKVGRKTGLEFIKKNKIKYLKIGREYKILKKSLTDFLEGIE